LKCFLYNLLSGFHAKLHLRGACVARVCVRRVTLTIDARFAHHDLHTAHFLRTKAAKRREFSLRWGNLGLCGEKEFPTKKRGIFDNLVGKSREFWNFCEI
jgi:hypothetical protein